jgi:Zn finger protein HypA/HybF involved in hydrogenase expression
VTGFVVVCCFLLYGFIKDDITRDTVNHETSLADTVIKSAHYSMLKADQEGMHRIIANIGSQEGVEHIRIFNRSGVISYSNDKTELNHTVDKESAGCKGCHAGAVPLTSLGKMDQARRFVNKKGVPVIAITTAIYNEPACASAACHIHPDQQKVLGILDIGLSAVPLNQTLSVISSRMILFCLMVLLLTIGGVAAILRRSVFLPLSNLVEYTSLRRKDFPHQEHPSPGCEIKDLEYNFRLMEERLRIALATPATSEGEPTGDS